MGQVPDLPFEQKTNTGRSWTCPTQITIFYNLCPNRASNPLRTKVVKKTNCRTEHGEGSSSLLYLQSHGPGGGGIRRQEDSPGARPEVSPMRFAARSRKSDETQEAA